MSWRVGYLVAGALVSGKEIRDQLGEQPGVNRPVERHTGRLTPTARHELVGRLLVRWGLRPCFDARLTRTAVLRIS